MYGREVLSRGIIKRIGPGTSVDIWDDNWIPGTNSMKPLVRLPGITMNKVSELFALGSRTWDVDLVRNSFISLDVDEILKIQPSRTMNDDVLAWAHERNGH